MARKTIIPKRIGGVKIPKKLRKLGDQVLQDPRAREVAGSALLALGTALLSRNTRPGSILRDIFLHPAESARTARDGAEEAASRAGDAASGVADAVTQALGGVFDAVRRDLARKMRSGRADEAGKDRPAPKGKDDEDEDRMH